MPYDDRTWRDRPDWRALFYVVGLAVFGLLALGATIWKLVERVGR